MPVRLVISPSSGLLTSTGQILRLNVTLFDASGNSLTGISIAWSSSNSAVASVSADGVVIARSEGTTQITAAAGGIRAEIQVTVARSPNRIVITPDSARLTSKSETLILNAVVLDASDAPIPDAQVTWSSDNPEVASVDANGLVTAHANGVTQITAASGSASTTIRVTVTFERQTNRLVVSPESVNLTSIGETVQLTARVLDANDMEIQGAQLTWTSEDPTVATVDDQGVVTARMNGETQVTVSWEDLSASVTVTVTVEQQVHGILVAPQTVHFATAGETKEIFVLVIDADDMAIPDAELTWTSENPAVATVDDQGVVTARMEGVTRVTVTSGGHSVHVMVIVGTPTTLVVSTESVRLTAIGETFYPIAKVYDAYNMEIPGADLTWTSEDPTVATVDEYGEVTARMNGQTIVTVTWEDMSDSIAVTVAQQADQIVVTPGSVHLSAIGEMIQLDAAVFDANDVEITAAEVSWVSERPTVASVDDRGQVTAHMTGTTQITVSSGSVSETVVVSVGAAPTDRASLVHFYHATDGPNWTDNTNWLTDEPLDQWHGISVNSTGRVESIWLNRNDLEGHIPASLASLVHLERLSLAHNELSGAIPAEVGNLARLQRLNLSVNQFSGGIPSSIGQLSELSVLDFQLNQLTGNIPSTLGNLSNLTYLRLGGNPLSGSIPSSLGHLDKLQRLFLSQAGLTGAIPTTFGGLASLKELHMQGNALSGSIPEGLGRLEHLVSLRLTDNAGLTGPLPRSFLNLDLQALYLFGTQVCLPRDLEFEEWKLSFHSRFVLDCEAGPDLTALEAMYNWMGGKNWTNNTNWRSARPISGWFGVSVNSSGRVDGIELPGNGLTGEIQIAIGGLADLERLNLGGNDLSGTIPGALGQLDNLSELKLNGNPRLSGSLHKDLVDLDLSTLWLQGTVVCATDDSDVQAWIRDIADARVADCVTSSSDRDVLEALYNATNGAGWTRNGNWLSDMPISDWYGVVTDSEGRVQRLDIGFNGLNGTIPSSLGNLKELRWMNLSENSLSGTIPGSLGGLDKLEFAYLQGNDLSGGIPTQLGNLSKLQLLNLSGNSLAGTIPGSLGNLANLEGLFLAGNRLTGAIPVSVSRLSNLEYLDLGRNSLSGEIPGSLGNLTNLIVLGLASNGFSGGIPTGLGNLSSLETMNLNDNSLTGGVPSSLGNLGALTTLDLSSNDLSGRLPSSLGNLENLESLMLDENTGLTGPLPYGLINSSLETLLAGGTGLCAPSDKRFLDWLADVPRKSVSRCSLSAEDRATLVAFYNATDGPNWTGVTINWLSNRPISEWSRVTVDSTGRVSQLTLSSHGLSGELPSSLGSLDNLTRLYLARNSLTGSIPSALGNLTHLQDLYLHRNQLTGSIPSALGSLENLDGLGLDGNLLTGSIPTSLGDLARLRYLYLENNSLSGGIPASLGKLSNLLLLNLQNNEDLTGALPDALTGMTSLNTLNLDGTGLCVPRTDAFQTWLDGIGTKQFEYCVAE